MIFIAAATQGVFLSIVLSLKKLKSQTLLASLILSFSACLFYYTAYWANVLPQLPKFFGLAMGFTYLFGPLLYFYIRSGRNAVFFSWIHMIPFGLFCALFIYQNYLTDEIIVWLNGIQILVQNAHLILYAGLIYGRINKSEDRNPQLQLWRMQLFIAFLGYALSFLAYYILVWSNLIKIEYDYAISLAAAIFIYFVGYKGFANPEVLSEYDRQRYQKSSLSSHAAQSIMKKIKDYFDNEKPYRNSDLRLTDVADRLETSVHQISQAMNDYEGISFSDFVNKYRFEEAKSMLSSPQHMKSRIIDIAYDCGFNNKTSFSNVFKRYEGMNPSEYRKMTLKTYLLNTE